MLPREPLRCPDPRPGCLWVPGRGCVASLPGAGPGLWGRMELGPDSSFDSQRGDLDDRKRPTGVSQALPAAREARGMLSGPCRVHSPQHHPRCRGGPVTSPGPQRNEGTRATEGWVRVDWEPPAPRELGEVLALWGASGSRTTHPRPPVDVGTGFTAGERSPALCFLRAEVFMALKSL